MNNNALKPKHLIRFDWAMKRLLRSKANFGILEGFLGELLKREVKILEVLDSESNKHDQTMKFNRVDILVKLDSDDGEIVLIEVQVSTESDYFCRMLFGASKIVTEHMKEGDAYAKIKKIYSVNILYFDLGHGLDYVYHGTTSFTGIHQHDQLDLSAKQKAVYQKDAVYQIYPEYYLIKVDQFNDVAKDTLDEWIYFLKNETIQDNFQAKGLHEAKEKLDSLKLNEADKQAYSRYIEDLSLQKSMVYSNYHDGKYDGLVEGEAKGRAEGLAEGVIKGRAEGKAEHELKLKNMILMMHKNNIDYATIAQASGFSVDEIKRIIA